MTSPVLKAVPPPPMGATPRSCALGAGVPAGATTVTSTEPTVCPVATFTTPAVVAGLPEELPVGGGASELPDGAAEVPPQPTRNNRNKRAARGFTIVSSYSSVNRKDGARQLRSCH